MLVYLLIRSVFRKLDIGHTLCIDSLDLSIDLCIMCSSVLCLSFYPCLLSKFLQTFLKICNAIHAVQTSLCLRKYSLPTDPFYGGHSCLNDVFVHIATPNCISEGVAVITFILILMDFLTSTCIFSK